MREPGEDAGQQVYDACSVMLIVVIFFQMAETLSIFLLREKYITYKRYLSWNSEFGVYAGYSKFSSYRFSIQLLGVAMILMGEFSSCC